MTLANNIFGQTYDDVEPCFLVSGDGGMAYDRVNRKWITIASLDQLAASKGYTFGKREIGVPSDEWQKTYMIGFAWADQKPIEPSPTPPSDEDEVEVKEKKPKKKKE